MKYGGDYYIGSLDDVKFEIFRTESDPTVSEECTNKMEVFISDGLIMEKLMEEVPLFFLTVPFMKDSFMKIVPMEKMVNTNLRI